MKIVVVSDLHFDKDTLGVPRMKEVCGALDQAVVYAIDEEADAFLCLGDIADPDNGGGTLHAIKACCDAALHLDRHKIKNVWIAGNHDVSEDGSGATCLSPIAALEDQCTNEMIYVAEQPRLIDLEEKLTLLCLPYAPVSHTYDPDAKVKEILTEIPIHRRVIVAAHLMIPGVIVGEETTDMPRGKHVAYPLDATRDCLLRLCGHYHKRQVFDPGDGGSPIYIPGTPCLFTFGEENNTPAFLVITI